MSESRSYRGARDPVNRELWKLVMEQEFEGFKGEGILTPADLYPGRKPLRAKWVYEYRKQTKVGKVPSQKPTRLLWETC